jgi:hypothetical protein
LASLLSPYPSLASTSLDAVSIIKTIATLPSDAPETLILKHAFADAIKTIWAVMCGISGLALIATLGIKGYKLDQALVGEQRFVDGMRTIEDSKRDEEGRMTDPNSATDIQEK